MTGLPAAQPDNFQATAHAPAQVAAWPPDAPAPALVGNRALARVIRQALCTESSLDADEWFPVSSGAQEARREAAAAITICQACPVRSQCLAFSLRHWEIGQHGVWGGMVAAFMMYERARASPDSERQVDSRQRADGSAIQEETNSPISAQPDHRGYGS